MRLSPTSTQTRHSGGEWDEFGFTYTADDGEYYLVQYYRKLDATPEAG